MGRGVVVALPWLAAVGCGPREPGPAEDEFGATFLWTYDTVAVAFDACPDAPDFLEPWTSLEAEVPGTSLSYQVAEDGATATLMSCDSTELETCVVQDEPAVTFEIDGHHLSGAGDLAPQDLTPTCDLVVRTVIDVEDEGETATLVTELRHRLDGSCAGVDDDIAEDSPNGVGVDGCVVTLDGAGSLTAID